MWFNINKEWTITRIFYIEIKNKLKQQQKNILGLKKVCIGKMVYHYGYSISAMLYYGWSTLA